MFNQYFPNEFHTKIPYHTCENLLNNGKGASQQAPPHEFFPEEVNRRYETSNSTSGTSTIDELKGYAIILTSACFLGITATAMRSSQNKLTKMLFKQLIL